MNQTITSIKEAQTFVDKQIENGLYEHGGYTYCCTRESHSTYLVKTVEYSDKIGRNGKSEIKQCHVYSVSKTHAFEISSDNKYIKNEILFNSLSDCSEEENQ